MDSIIGPLASDSRGVVAARRWNDALLNKGIAASQILTVLSRDAHATCFESGENATELTESLWPSRIWVYAFQLSSIAGLVVIHSGSSSVNRSLIMLRAG